MNNNAKKAMCGICPSACWVEVKFDSEQRISEVKPDDSSPLGAICKLGEHSADIVYSKDRLKYPMKRIGAKGTYEFERISWDEAYGIIVNKLNSIKSEYGPEATAIYTGRGSFELAMCDVFQPAGVAISSASSVLFPFGSPNTLGVGALCYVSFAMIAPHVTMGGMWHYMFSDIENAETIVVWGANPATDSPPRDLDRIVQANNRGARVVVIDPRRTKTVKMTNAEWIPIRPGTDGALALGICNILIEEELCDDDFVENQTIGFDDFSKYIQHFTPELVENITGVPADRVKSLARLIAGSNGAAPIMYSGLEYSDSGVQAIRAIMTLWALAGQLDVPGGRCFSMRENQFPVNRSGLVSNPNTRKALGRDRFPVYSEYRGESHAIALPDSVLNGNPYKIRSLIILGGSIATSWPEPDIWKRTLNELDFLVCIDRQLTADAAFADIVLPATTMYEIESYQIYGPLFRIREKVIEPVGEARNDFFILSELARRLGYGHLYPQNETELLEYVLEGSGFGLDEVKANGGIAKLPSVMMQYKKWEKGLLRPDGKPGFDTPSGRFEIASSILEEHGYNPLPVYTEPSEGPVSNPELAKSYPLVFNSGARVTTDFRPQHHGVESLCRNRPEPTVTINSGDARERSIENGDLVYVKTKRGKVKLRAYVTDDIVRGAIDANMGGGGPIGPMAWQQCNINELTDLRNFDPISGFPVYKTLLCEVEKANESGDKLIIDSGESESPISRDIAIDEYNNAERIYLDNNATTPLHPEAAEIMIRFLSGTFGNASAIYAEGRQAGLAIESARRSVAQLINCTARRIIFTSGGTEANNMAIKGIALKNRNDGNHIITSKIEHPSVLNTFRQMEEYGFDVTYLDVGEYGIIRPAQLTEEIRHNTCLISLMAANNETGAIQPIIELAGIAESRGVLFHCDCVQAIGKIPVDVDELGVDMLTISGHKLYGPKGIGALYIRKGMELARLISGGHQEHSLRAGTENVAAIAGFGKAARIAISRLNGKNNIEKLRDRLESEIVALLPGAKLNGHRDRRLPNTLNMVLPDMRGESLVLAMDQKGVAMSSGSACRSGLPDPSHVLLAMGLAEEEVHRSIRFSLGHNTTEDEIDKTIELLAEIIRDVKETVRFVTCR